MLKKTRGRTCKSWRIEGAQKEKHRFTILQSKFVPGPQAKFSNRKGYLIALWGCAQDFFRDHDPAGQVQGPSPPGVLSGTRIIRKNRKCMPLALVTCMHDWSLLGVREAILVFEIGL